MIELNAFLVSAALALVVSFILAAPSFSGIVHIKLTRVALLCAWIASILGVCGAMNNAPLRHLLIAGAVLGIPLAALMIAFERWIARQVTNQNSQRRTDLEMRFPEGHNVIDGPIVHTRIGIENIGAVVAENVEVLLTMIAPRPKAQIFRGDYPYQLRDADGNLGKSNINPGRTVEYELVRSWISAENVLMVDGLDTKPNGHRFAMEPDERWKVYIEIHSANANYLIESFKFTPGIIGVEVERT